MSNLVEHAKRELKLAGLFDKDSDYDGMLGNAVLELVEAFAKQGHSGFSAGMTRDLFAKLAAFKPLTPIGTTADEWFSHGNMGPGGEPIWQNVRRGSTFSRPPRNRQGNRAMTSEELLACDDPRELHTEISRLRALTKSQAEENARLREALWPDMTTGMTKIAERPVPPVTRAQEEELGRVRKAIEDSGATESEVNCPRCTSANCKESKGGWWSCPECLAPFLSMPPPPPEPTYSRGHLAKAMAEVLMQINTARRLDFGCQDIAVTALQDFFKKIEEIRSASPHPGGDK